MTVWLVLRRGRWFSRILSMWLSSDGLLYKQLRKLGTDSWMSSALVFTSPCTGAHCVLCARTRSDAAAIKKRGYHVLTFDANVEHGVQAIVDDPFAYKPEAWLFIELPRISNSAALKFFNHTSGLQYNYPAINYNFLAWPWGRSIGVQADNEMGLTTHVTCSEAITAFLQVNGYPMELTPCRTTPQQLAEELIDTFPDELAKLQYQIDPHSSSHAPLQDRLVLVR